MNCESCNKEISTTDYVELGGLCESCKIAYDQEMDARDAESQQ